MAKKKTKNKNNLLYGLLTICSAVLTFVSLAFHFVGSKASTSGILGSNSSSSTMSLGDWFDFVTDAEKVEGIVSWQIARILFIVALVLVGLIAIGIVVNYFIKNKSFSTAIKIVSALTIVVALVFVILMFVGSSALSNSANLGGIIGGAYTYYPYLATYFITVFSMLSAVFACLATKKK